MNTTTKKKHMLCGCAVKQISFRCSSCQPVWLLLIVRLCACHIQTATLFSRSTISFISIKKIDSLFLKCRFFPTYRFKSQKSVKKKVKEQQLINLFFFTRVRMDQMDRIQRFQQSLKKEKNKRSRILQSCMQVDTILSVVFSTAQ